MTDAVAELHLADAVTEPEGPQRLSWESGARRVVTIYVPLACFVLILLFPFYWMAVTAFKPNRDKALFGSFRSDNRPRRPQISSAQWPTSARARPAMSILRTASAGSRPPCPFAIGRTLPPYCRQNASARPHNPIYTSAPSVARPQPATSPENKLVSRNQVFNEIGGYSRASGPAGAAGTPDDPLGLVVFRSSPLSLKFLRADFARIPRGIKLKLVA